MRQVARKVVCTSAATPFYKTGKVYPLYVDKQGIEYVKGSDGLFDNLKKMTSKFVKYEGSYIRTVDD